MALLGLRGAGTDEPWTACWRGWTTDPGCRAPAESQTRPCSVTMRCVSGVGRSLASWTTAYPSHAASSRAFGRLALMQTSCARPRPGLALLLARCTPQPLSSPCCVPVGPGAPYAVHREKSLKKCAGEISSHVSARCPMCGMSRYRQDISPRGMSHARERDI